MNDDLKKNRNDDSFSRLFRPNGLIPRARFDQPPSPAVPLSQSQPRGSEVETKIKTEIKKYVKREGKWASKISRSRKHTRSS